MKDTKTVLFIGGPRDGRRVAVPMDMETFVADELLSPATPPSVYTEMPPESVKVRRHMYREERLSYQGPKYPLGYETPVFLHEDIPAYQLIERLVAGYKKP